MSSHDTKSTRRRADSRTPAIRQAERGLREAIEAGLAAMRQLSIDLCHMDPDTEQPADDERSFLARVSRDGDAFNAACEKIELSLHEVDLATIISDGGPVSVVTLAILFESLRLGHGPRDAYVKGRVKEEYELESTISFAERIDSIERSYRDVRIEMFADPEHEDDLAMALGVHIARHGWNDPFAHDLWDPQKVAQSLFVSGICAAVIGCIAVVVDGDGDTSIRIPDEVERLVHSAGHLVDDLLDESDYANLSGSFLYGSGSRLTEDILIESTLIGVLDPDELHRLSGSLVPTFLAARQGQTIATLAIMPGDGEAFVLRMAQLAGQMVGEHEDIQDDEEPLTTGPRDAVRPPLLN
jgi:hypothetical protein